MRSAVGSTKDRVVSKSSAVEPSTTMLRSERYRPDTVGLVIVLFVRVSVVSRPTSVVVKSGRVTTRSAVGSPEVRVSSNALAVVPSCLPRCRI